MTGWATKMTSGVPIQGDVYGFLCQEMRSGRRALISSEIDGLGTKLTVGLNSRREKEGKREQHRVDDRMVLRVSVKVTGVRASEWQAGPTCH